MSSAFVPSYITLLKIGDAMRLTWPALPAAALLWAAAHVLQLPAPCKGRKVAGLSCPFDGGDCHEPEKPWQHDGVCIAGSCHLPDTRTFQLAVVAKHRRLTKIRGAKPVKELWMRGSGPGLSWDKAVQMKKTAIVDEWKLNFVYQSDSNAIPCHSSDRCIYNQRALEMRLYRDEQGKDEMYGPNFFVALPLSHSMSGAPDSMIPEVTIYPWFDVDKITTKQKEISYETVFHTPDTTVVPGGVRKVENTFQYQLLLPPSFHANVRKTYPLVIVWASATLEQHRITQLLETMFIYESSIEEVVVAILDYGDLAPFCRLSPYAGGKIWRCKGGKVCHECMSCWHHDRSSMCDTETFRSQASRCLSKLSCRAHGEEVLDIIDKELLPNLLEDKDTKKRVNVDSLHRRLSMIGFDGAGLLACHAALTRPVTYRNVACLSAPFAWPLDSLTSANETGYSKVFADISDKIILLPGSKMIYHTQKYFIDVATEPSFYFPVVDARNHTMHFISRLKKVLGLRMNDNIWYGEVPNSRYNYHLYDITNDKPLAHRMKHPLSYFFRAEGSASLTFLQHKLEMDAAIQSGTAVPALETEGGRGQWGTGVNDTRFFCPHEGQSMMSMNISVPVYLLSVGEYNASSSIIEGLRARVD